MSDDDKRTLADITSPSTAAALRKAYIKSLIGYIERADRDCLSLAQHCFNAEDALLETDGHRDEIKRDWRAASDAYALLSITLRAELRRVTEEEP